MTQYRRAPGIQITSVEDDLFLVDPRTDGIFHLNAVGAGIWNLLAAPQSIDAVAAVVSDAFPDQPREDVAHQVRELMGDLEKRGLVVSGPA